VPEHASSPQLQIAGTPVVRLRATMNLGMEPFEQLPTEARNPASEEIDRLPTLEMLRVINQADREVADAVQRELSSIASAVDAIVARMRQGGRLFYIGAGTSGRLGVLDASECPPTFSVPSDLVQGIMAGGDVALRAASEDVEDDARAGAADLEAYGFRGKDAVVGIATSGRTPYVLGALEFAQALGALTIGLTCFAESPIAAMARIAISPMVGPEVVAGSTRLKAGTATKLVLNMLSTGAMIRLGHVYGNLMVNVQPTNEKLLARARGIVALLCGLDAEQAAALLDRAGSVKAAVVMHRMGLCREDAEQSLAIHGGSLRSTLESSSSA